MSHGKISYALAKAGYSDDDIERLPDGIMSDSTRSRDLNVKLNKYRDKGVKE